MGARVFGYARVSSKEQNLERQLKALREQGIEERDIFTDKASGKNFNREGYQRMIEQLREGDTLYILSLDRLGRNYNDVKEQWQLITETIGADVVVIDMPLLDTRGSDKAKLDNRFIANLTLEILSYVAEKERESIKERQRQGIELAKQKGVYKGRPKNKKPDNWDEVIKEWKDKKITAVEAMRRTETTRATFYRMVKREEEQGAE